MITPATTGSSTLPGLLSLLLFVIVSSEETIVTCQDHFEECDYWKTTGMCSRPYMRRHCPKSCEAPCAGVVIGVPQYMGGTYSHLIKDIVEESVPYMMTNTIKDCRNQYRECASWAAGGHCLSNPGLMQVKCAPACQSCDKVDFESRCTFAEDDNVWRSGDVRRVMEKLESDSHDPQSRRTINSPPYVAVLENFATEKESKRLLEREEWEYEYVEQQVEEDVFERVINENRTYASAVCGEVCEQDAWTLLERIEQATGIPKVNAEYIELRRYERGQGKALDRDYQEFELQHPQGVRIATMHIFLSDGYDAGAIHIPILNVTIPSKFGRAVVWANVLDNNPNLMDPPMQYSIEPATTGTHYSATVYLHQRDYKKAEKWACHQPQNDVAQTTA